MKSELKLKVTPNSKSRFLSFVLLLILLSVPVCVSAQVQNPDENLPSPKGALLRSFVVPGWGHHYIDKTDWRRGQYHMAAEAVMVLAYAGISLRTNQLEGDLEAYAMHHANTDISNRGRDFMLAIADFDNLDEYNDYQLRSRQWDNLITESPQNEWNWDSVDSRFEYQDMRERIDQGRNQLPALLTLMVANRIVSGISAFIKARDMGENLPEASFSYLNEFGEPGFTASLRFGF